MSLTRSLAHNTLAQVIGKAISTFLGLVAVSILAHHLGTEKFGWYVTATGFLQFIGILVDFGFTVTTSNMLAEPEFDKERLFNTIFTWRVITAAIAFVIAPLIILAFPYRTEIKIAAAVTAISFFCNTINQVYIGYYRQKLSLYIPTLSEVLGRMLLVAGFALLVWGKAGFLPLMGVITLATLGSTAYLMIKFGKIKFAFDRDISQALFYKMWPTAVSVICNSLYLQADRVILPLYASQSTVGMYGLAYRVLDITTQISAIVMGMIMPLITFAWSRGMAREFRERYQLGVDFLALILFPMVVGIYVLATPIMRLIGSNTFTGSGIMLQWLSVSIFGTCFGMTFGHIVLAINRQKEALFVYATDAALSLTGYLLFIPKYGWRGAVMVTIFSEFYAGLLLSFLSVVYSGIVPRFGTMGRILLASIIMGLVINTVSLSLIPSIVLGMVVYGFCVFIFGVVKPSTVQQIFSLVKVA